MALLASNIQSTNIELQEIINNSWDGICIIDKQTKFIYLNDAFSPMLGFPKEELLSQSFLNFIEKKDKAAFLQLLKENVLNAYHTDINVVCQRKDGKSIYLKITVSLMLNKKYFVVNAKDITKEISDDEILDEYVLSFHTNKEGTITKVSQAFCKLSGYNKEELLERSFCSLRHKEEAVSSFGTLCDGLNEKEEIKERIHFAKKNQEAFIVDLTMKSIFNKYGDITGYTALMFDMTTELYLDQKLSIENSKLEIMSDTIKTISHEWRQPLNIISLKAQSLQFDVEDSNVIEVLEDIKHTSKELSDTIEDFQNIMKNKSDIQKVDLSIAIQNIIAKYKQKYENVIDFNLNNEVLGEKELYVKELKQILFILFQNSQEAFDLNDISKPSISVKTYAQNNTLHILVQDNAKGIEKEVLSKIFEPYFSTKEKRHGVGLGLYKCKMLIQMHLGGNIQIQNKDNGIEVHIQLPID
jgi:PAS domain S-box-containing protein